MLCMTVVCLGGYAVYMGQSLAASAAFVSALAALAGAFKYGSNQQKQEREKRAKLMAGK